MQADIPKLRAKYQARVKRGEKLVSNLLAISGGADEGAFGAGLLVGWTAHGDRPEFDLVTGISAGALIAPFAFLGPEYDKQLAGLFTAYDADQIYKANVLSGLLAGNALADTAPLAELIENYVDDRFLRRVAEERAKGRFLLIGTTNLDAQRPVYWDMGKIAQSSDPGAPELFRRVLLASASFPGIFPPVHIKVQAGGNRSRRCMSTAAPRARCSSPSPTSATATSTRRSDARSQRRLWVIRNGKITPEYKVTPNSTFSIAERSIETLAKHRGFGDLTRMYVRAKADGIDFNLAAIPAEFSAPHPKPFDRAYMKALYEVGFSLGRIGYAWVKLPPETVLATRD